MDDPTSAPLLALRDSASAFLPRLAAAVTIAVGAVVVALLLRRLILALARRTELERRARTPGLARILGDTAMAFIALLALPAVLEALALQGLLQPVNAMLGRLLGFLPNALGAALTFAIGWLVADVVRRIAIGALEAAGSARWAERAGLGASLGERRLSGVVGNVVFALVMLPVVGAAVQVLGLDTIARPVTQLLDAVTSLVPRLLSAAIIVAIAAWLGRLAGSLVSGLLVAVGVNAWPARLGLPADFRAGGRDAAELGGVVVSTGVMLIALAQASEVLGFGVLTEAVRTTGAVLARCVVALLVLLAGVGLAGWLAALVEAGALDRTAARRRGRLVRAAVIFFAAALALRQAGLPAEIVTLAFGAVVVGLSLAVALAFGLGGRERAGRWLTRWERDLGMPEAGEPTVDPAVRGHVADDAADASASGAPSRTTWPSLSPSEAAAASEAASLRAAEAASAAAGSSLHTPTPASTGSAVQPAAGPARGPSADDGDGGDGGDGGGPWTILTRPNDPR